jgi:hypothetical protein
MKHVSELQRASAGAMHRGGCLDALEAPTIQTGRLVVCWDIGGGASRLEVSVGLCQRGDALRLGAIRAALLAQGAERTIEIPAINPGACLADPHTGLVHIDVPGALHISLRGELEFDLSRPAPQEAPLQVLFARTTALERLGIEGGRYEVSGCRWERGEPGRR